MPSFLPRLNDSPQLAVILASTSPRRQELLAALAARFTVVSPDFAEVWDGQESPEAYVQRNAQGKAASVGHKAANQAQTHETLVIAADTICELDGKILEKPESPAGAEAMLAHLSGRTHRVYSGLSLHYRAKNHPPKTLTQSVMTEVTFKALSPQEIHAYVATGEPMDKAGSYAAQGLGAYMVQSIKGSYTNIIGLPLCELYLSCQKILA